MPSYLPFWSIFLQNPLKHVMQIEPYLQLSLDHASHIPLISIQ